MNRKKISRLIARAKEAARLLPYLLPAIVLSVSLASSLLVAGASQNTLSTGPKFMGTDEPPPPPSDQLRVTVNEPQNTEHNTSQSIPMTMDRNVVDTPPFISPDPYTVSPAATAGVQRDYILPLADAESNAIIATVNSPGPDGGTASVHWDGVNWILTYQSLVTFHGTETFRIKLKDSPGNLSKTVTVLVPVS